MPQAESSSSGTGCLLGCAPEHDRERPGGRALDAAGDRAVDHSDPSIGSFGEAFGQGADAGRRRGRADHEQQATLAREQAVGAVEEGLELRQVGEHDEHRVSAGAEVAGCRGPFGAVEVGGSGARVHDDAPAGREEPARHRSAHGAEAEYADDLVSVGLCGGHAEESTAWIQYVELDSTG